MGEDQARKTVMAVILIVSVIVFWENIVHTGNVVPPAKTVVTMLVLFAGLSVGASIAPEIVGPLSLLIGAAIAISRVPSVPGPFLTQYAAPPPSSKVAGTATPPGKGMPV